MEKLKNLYSVNNLSYLKIIIALYLCLHFMIILYPSKFLALVGKSQGYRTNTGGQKYFLLLCKVLPMGNCKGSEKS